MVAGFKQCPECTLYVPAVSKWCRLCKHQFFTHRKKRTKRRARGELIENWKELKPGDIIKVANDDHFLFGDVQVACNNTGTYKVMRVQNDGLVLFNKHGFAFQCMVWRKPSIAGIVRTPTTIWRKVSDTKNSPDSLNNSQ